MKSKILLVVVTFVVIAMLYHFWLGPQSPANIVTPKPTFKTTYYKKVGVISESVTTTVAIYGDSCIVVNKIAYKVIPTATNKWQSVKDSTVSFELELDGSKFYTKEKHQGFSDLVMFTK